MNPQFNQAVTKIRDFWVFVSDNLQHIKPRSIADDSSKLNSILNRGEDPKKHYLNLSVSTLVYLELQEKLAEIDADIEVFINTDMIAFQEYTLGDEFKELAEKMAVVRYGLEFSVSGNSEKFLLIEALVSASHDYTLPADWIITSFKQRARDYQDYALIPFSKNQFEQTAIGVSAIQFVLKPLTEFSKEVVKSINPSIVVPLDQQFDLLIVIEDQFAVTLKSQQEVFMLRNSVFVWLEHILGEYNTARNIARLTIIPEQGLTQMVKGMSPNEGAALRAALRNGVYLIPELTEKINPMRECLLCGIREIHTALHQHKDNGTIVFDDFHYKYPHIREGYYCGYCFGLLQRCI